jgi:hypothetical protein
MAIIKQGDLFDVKVGWQGMRDNVSLKILIPCCKRESRPYLDQVLRQLAYGHHFPLQCNGCKWWWQIIAVRKDELGNPLEMTLQA